MELIIIVFPEATLPNYLGMFFLSSRKINFRILSNSPGCPHLLYNYSVAPSLGKSCQHSHVELVRLSDII